MNALLILAIFVVGIAILRLTTGGPIGCPQCGAPEPEQWGWVRCEECGKVWWREV